MKKTNKNSDRKEEERFKKLHIAQKNFMKEQYEKMTLKLSLLGSNM